MKTNEGMRMSATVATLVVALLLGALVLAPVVAAGGYSGDDAYDLAAGADPDGLVSGIPAGFSGDDPYDPASSSKAALYVLWNQPNAAVVAEGQEPEASEFDVDSARYAALGKHYQESILRGIEADTARYVGLGRHYVAAVAQPNSYLVENPELMAAHRYMAAAALASDETRLAANPELIVAQRYIAAAAATASEARLAANPELKSVIRYEDCGC